MTVSKSGRRISATRMQAVAGSLLDASPLCAIATVDPRGRSHINTAYFAWNGRLDIVWLSDPAAGHSRNIEFEPSVAAAVFDSRQSWGGRDEGIQLFGTARVLSGTDAKDAELVYTRRFPGYAHDRLSAYRFYRLRPTRVKLFDERTFGEGVFVIANVSGGTLSWRRTEVYRGSSAGPSPSARNSRKRRAFRRGTPRPGADSPSRTRERVRHRPG
jgi:uncharacterized protein